MLKRFICLAISLSLVVTLLGTNVAFAAFDQTLAAIISSAVYSPTLDLYVASGTNANSYTTILVSKDGKHWARIPLANFSGTSPYNDAIGGSTTNNYKPQEVTWGNNEFVIVSGTSVYTSSNGITWVRTAANLWITTTNGVVNNSTKPSDGSVTYTNKVALNGIVYDGTNYWATGKISDGTVGPSGLIFKITPANLTTPGNWQLIASSNIANVASGATAPTVSFGVTKGAVENGACYLKLVTNKIGSKTYLDFIAGRSRSYSTDGGDTWTYGASNPMYAVWDMKWVDESGDGIVDTKYFFGCTTNGLTAGNVSKVPVNATTGAEGTASSVAATINGTASTVGKINNFATDGDRMVVTDIFTSNANRFLLSNSNSINAMGSSMNFGMLTINNTTSARFVTAQGISYLIGAKDKGFIAANNDYVNVPTSGNPVNYYLMYIPADENTVYTTNKFTTALTETAQIKITGNDVVVPGTEYTYTASLVDFTGTTTAATPTWSIVGGTPTGVTLNGNIITVDSSMAGKTFKIKATSGDYSAVKTINSEISTPTFVGGLTANGSLRASVGVNVAVTDLMLALAVYTSDNRLYNFQYVTSGSGLIAGEQLSTTMTFDGTLPSGCTARAFVWDTLNTMKPLLASTPLIQ